MVNKSWKCFCCLLCCLLASCSLHTNTIKEQPEIINIVKTIKAEKQKVQTIKKPDNSKAGYIDLRGIAIPALLRVMMTEVLHQSYFFDNPMETRTLDMIINKTVTKNDLLKSLRVSLSGLGYDTAIINNVFVISSGSGQNDSGQVLDRTSQNTSTKQNTRQSNNRNEQMESAVFNAIFARPSDLVAITKSISTTGNMVADDSLRKIVITGNNEFIHQSKDLLTQLDSELPQARVKIRMVEVTLSDDLAQGVGSWLGVHIGDTVVGGGIGSSFASSSNALASLLTSGSVIAGIQSDLIRGAVQWLETSGRGRVLASPEIVSTNGQKSTITVGDEVPYQSGSESSVSGGVLSSIAYKKTGITLNITPDIKPDSIGLNIDVSFSDSKGESTTPTIHNRSIQSIVSCPSGSMLFLGGLIYESKTSETNSLPSILSMFSGLDINKAQSKYRTELIILVEPEKIQSDNYVDLSAFQLIKAKYGN